VPTPPADILTAEPGSAVPPELVLPAKVVALDLDGTILPPGLELTELTIHTLEAARRAGVRILIATGRMHCSALPYARRLGLSEALVSYQGALIKHITTGETLYHRPIPLDLALEVLGPLEAEGHSLNVYVDDELYVRDWTDDVRRYQRISRVPVHAVGTLSRYLTVPTTKIVVTGDPLMLDELVERLQEAFGDRLYVAKSLPFFLEIASPEVSKSSALALLGRRYGFAPADVVAFGDSFNDTDMLRWAGLGVAMGNAPEPVRAAADAVCAAVDEDGVARFLLSLAQR
jgi:Cof subfamily protein (haloacid dehalogenase superfamily)